MEQFWNSEIETMPQDKIKELQLNFFNQQLKRAKNVSAYRRKLPQSISNLDEIKNIPLISKEDLRQNFPYGFLAIPKDKIIRYNATSGTTGIPSVSYFSKNDLDILAENETVHFYRAGLRSNHILQCMVGFGLFTAGWGGYYGSLGIGASILPVGPGNTVRQISLLKQFKSDFTFSNPSYLQYLLSSITKDDWKDISLKTAITGGEPLSLNTQKIIKENYNIDVFNFYGMVEFGTHIASECHFHQGLHIAENLFYLEIIDPNTGFPVPDGEYGEIVISNLKRDAMPLFRYRTRDIARIIPGNCPCGCTHRRIETITHRVDDMQIINGVNVFPSQIEECILKTLNCLSNYLIHIKETNGLKKMTIDIELENDLLGNNVTIKNIKEHLLRNLKASITISPSLNFIPKGTLPEISGKTKRVIIEE